MSYQAAHAQSPQTLHTFSSLDISFANLDGAFPNSSLIETNGILYGTASQGGLNAGGTVYSLATNGNSFRALYNFTPPNPSSGDPGDGAYPLGPVILSGTDLFGTTSAGGAFASGILFRLKNDGTGFTTLHSFSTASSGTLTNSDGAYPWGGLLLVGNTLYGTASRGGDSGSGTIYKIGTDGSSFTRLHSFGALDGNGQNSDGAYPLSGLILWSNALYGTTYRGGLVGTGTVFRVNLDGSGFVTLATLDGGSRGSLVAANNALYGTTDSGGTNGGGSVFRLNPDGSGFTNLINFANDPGHGPWAGLSVSANTLYGTTYGGGNLALGSVFSIGTDGTGFTNLYSFSGLADGSYPQGTLTPSSARLYGTASEGGNSSDGTVFVLSLGSTGVSSKLTIGLSNGQVVLRWPSSNGGTLQSTASLNGPVVWAPVSPAPVVVNGENVVTNTISGATKFYRLAP